jgi:hypothetical protein
MGSSWKHYLFDRAWLITTLLSFVKLKTRYCGKLSGWQFSSGKPQAFKAMLVLCVSPLFAAPPDDAYCKTRVKISSGRDFRRKMFAKTNQT